MADRQMSQRQRELARAIRLCLENLSRDARRHRLPELSHLIDVACLAAEDLERSRTPELTPAEALRLAEPAGHC